MKTQLVIPAAGMGTRLGADVPKALVEVGGTPLLVHTLRRFGALGDSAIVVIPGSHRSAFESVLRNFFAGLHLVDGDETRQASVFNGIRCAPESAEIVMIHDAARPFITEEAYRESIAAATELGAATVAVPVVDTILQGTPDAFLDATPDRRLLWACQTPQTFRREVILAAHEKAAADGYEGTDDASLARYAGHRVKLVMGTRLNLKVTTPQDLQLAEVILREGWT